MKTYKAIESALREIATMGFGRRRPDIFMRADQAYGLIGPRPWDLDEYIHFRSDGEYHIEYFCTHDCIR